jgi:hypothetical protein
MKGPGQAAAPTTRPSIDTAVFYSKYTAVQMKGPGQATAPTMKKYDLPPVVLNNP